MDSSRVWWARPTAVAVRGRAAYLLDHLVAVKPLRHGRWRRAVGQTLCLKVPQGHLYRVAAPRSTPYRCETCVGLGIAIGAFVAGPQDEDWVYAVGFRRGTGQKLHWVLTKTQDRHEAEMQGWDTIARAEPGTRWVLVETVKVKL